ncbi:MAG: TIM barrel protein [Puniceicoccales bacterium]|jgi:L-rhamnose isomerase/sugar isomerase|nr:TIM barrel protein [Puniceicoccales bacterium]
MKKTAAIGSSDSSAKSAIEQKIFRALDAFKIETPSWGYADTGTRFGKFFQDAAAIDLNDKLADAGQVHALTGCCPQVAVHVLWDFQPGQNPADVAKLADAHGVKIGAINPNLFQDQIYKYGSFANTDPAIRKAALDHTLYSIDLAKKLHSRNISMWLADGVNYPGQASIRARKKRMEDCLIAAHKKLAPDQLLLIEYKPFEPAFYATDIADWGMSFLYAKKAGKQARVLVDTGHHYTAQNIEQIVAWLLAENMLGGFHFNDRRYADDDLTLGSIDPYQAFRIFHEIHYHAFDNGGKAADIAYMIDQSHNDKSKIEATIQTVVTAQELYAKAALVDHKQLAQYQSDNSQIDAEELLKTAFFTDVKPLIREWRRLNKLPLDPLAAHRASGYEPAAAKERKARRKALGIVQGGSYA